MFTLPPLPYEKTALEPYITAHTLSFHYDKHHATYVKNLNDLTKDSPLANQTLEDVIQQAHGNPDMQGIFNNAAQVWNHTFYWHCMKPNGGGQPTGKLLEMIIQTFGDYETFAQEFKKAAVSQFGSGWAWLVQDGDVVKITKTGNADLPMAHGHTALLTCDVWEHAYYLDYQNRRPDYVTEFLNHLINWDFVASNLK